MAPPSTEKLPELLIVSVRNVLVRRGKELHEPGDMYLNPNQILCVEGVGPNSKVAQLIAQAQTQH